MTFTLLIILCIAVWFDLKTDKVPNWLILVGYGAGALFRIGQAADIPVYLERMALPIVILYPLFLIRGLGAGDIKLFSVISIFFVHGALFKIMLYSLFIGGAICIVNKVLSKAIQGVEAKRYIHYTVCILAGYLVFVFANNCSVT